MTFEAKKKNILKQKALVITSFNLRPYHPSTLLLPPCYHDYPYRPVPHTIFPYTIPQPRSFFPISFFFPACLTTLFAISVILTKIYLYLLSCTFGSRQIPSFWICEKKKGGNSSPSQQPLCTLLYLSVRSVARCIMGLPCWSVDGQARYKTINVQYKAKILFTVALHYDL